MSALWAKHIYHVIYQYKVGPLGREATWHIVAHGQRFLAVEVPTEFPCYGHRAKILSLIEDGDVERFPFATLSLDTEGRWSLRFTTGPPPALRCSLWAPLIDERDVHVLEWIRGEVKLAIWSGKRVIVKVGTSPCIDENHQVAAQSEAYRFLQNTNLTPKFLGHLVRDGVVVGFVLEELKGRSPGPDDREICRKAALKLYATGTFHSDLNKDNMIVTDAGDVLFVDMALLGPTTEKAVNESVDELFDGEIAEYPETYETPPTVWLDGDDSIDWDEERDYDIRLRGEPLPLPPVQKIYSYEDNPWVTAPRIPYSSDTYKPWEFSEVTWPSTILGHARPSLYPYHQFLSPDYLSLQLNPVRPRGLTAPGALDPLFFCPSEILSVPETDEEDEETYSSS